MRGYYNDIEDLDVRECKELLTYSNSDEVKRQAQFRIIQLEKLEQDRLRIVQLHDKVKKEKAKERKQDQKEYKVNRAKTANKERESASISSSRPTAWDIFVEIIKIIGGIAFWATIIMAFAS